MSTRHLLLFIISTGSTSCSNFSLTLRYMSSLTRYTQTGSFSMAATFLCNCSRASLLVQTKFHSSASSVRLLGTMVQYKPPATSNVSHSHWGECKDAHIKMRLCSQSQNKVDKILLLFKMENIKICKRGIETS
ncbi:hypothetical protein DB44_HG00010 [Candidatus Protochlamydia amoebophila]|uniref:Uncharacterized protein n=1 Tax=Candidatus Protochlamydia amoebophila TaxID=362787 RepID=A0A0C1JJA2_9BACT|nr:hypothetical protein DB44_HG00010 [Candidatus Protochlamydia amoebophila]